MQATWEKFFSGSAHGHRQFYGADFLPRAAMGSNRESWNLVYSTGQGMGHLGWMEPQRIPGVTRKKLKQFPVILIMLAIARNTTHLFYPVPKILFRSTFSRQEARGTGQERKACSHKLNGVETLEMTSGLFVVKTAWLFVWDRKTARAVTPLSLLILQMARTIRFCLEVDENGRSVRQPYSV